MTSLTQPLRTAFAPLLAALVLAGCATAPQIDPAALPTAPAAFKEGDGRWTQAVPPTVQADGAWWKTFSDPVLDGLVERALERNNSIQIAAARLAQARALLQATDAQRAPQIGIGADATRQGGAITPAGGGAGNLFRAGASFSWELDVFGRLSQASQAAALDADSREALLRNTRLLVQADVARSYLALRALDAERALVRETVGAYRDTLTLTERRFEAGDIAELDVARVRTELAATESDALALDRRRAEVEHALAVLVGDPASNFGLEAGEWTTVLPVIPAGVPSTVLTRRPDIDAARQSMLAAQARVGVAQAAWFPDIALTGSGGYASTDLGDLFKWSARSWGIGALLSLPIFDGGRREAGVRNASAELDAALAGYREQVLVAFKDVEDQLSALRLLADQSEAQSRAVASASRATVLSDVRYRSGLVSQLDLLDARRSELRNRREALQVRAAQYQATVALVRALGGGWGAVDDGKRAEGPARVHAGG
ncbi:efflux transporter outer membrane subunit [Aromatoleum toluvorans]|uniref:Efflux transporter outer membrane subunit n=1 Tax=Aromatoleum toluvorans TaxID=92002 RepID=A0ABX1Q3S1_9RHOO|nr:efflux transporter outer membrane subunit [Aromatoleum toluvorans]NMG45540.1 efflux transporter outer membrane subunit [Aromatoleum toluvorans]